MSQVEQFIAQTRCTLTSAEAVKLWTARFRNSVNATRLSIYIEGNIIDEMNDEAARRGLTLSGMVQLAWMTAQELKKNAKGAKP